MQARRLARFLLSYILLGAVVAAIILWLFPDWQGTGFPSRVVEVQEAPSERLADAVGRPQAGPVSYADAVDLAAPAVVNIFTSKRISRQDHPLYDDPMFRHFFGEDDEGERRRPEPTETNLGSGVIVSDGGFILTNNHVIDGADEIQVALADGRSTDAEVVGTDPETDLAVLRIRMQDLPVITLGRSEEARVGDVVLAIGNPFGVGQTVTQGIVSATGRSQLGLSTFENFIQTDAAINPGNSGGALINARGDMVGLNTAIFSGSGGSHGIGFAIPAELAQGVMESIIETGRVVRGWAGVEVQNLTRQLAESFQLDRPRGVLVAGIMRGGPADRAGLRPGDLILAIEGEEIDNAQDLLRLVTEQAPGQTIQFRGLSDGERADWELRVRERPRIEDLR
ncbi:trypsin-like peptidase domain-containing protein [Methylonatrum kenyense]|uniref:trypsin-like peptidase domain-containing protein n=1 Tax=Methylonatrum kenyense TaxID=455253 RepID=UPI0020BFC523|nr:trypsin-like peptidase domain-containing protein [Methylonatrum kenyense]MCK8516272.1 trypsin-like peptidase domain-containing protein [Methylonatrum kenyense]